MTNRSDTLLIWRVVADTLQKLSDDFKDGQDPILLVKAELSNAKSVVEFYESLEKEERERLRDTDLASNGDAGAVSGEAESRS